MGDDEAKDVTRWSRCLFTLALLCSVNDAREATPMYWLALELPMRDAMGSIALVALASYWLATNTTQDYDAVRRLLSTISLSCNY